MKRQCDRIPDTVTCLLRLSPVCHQVGGLGDVVTGLARTCLARGHQVKVCMPFYEALPQEQIDNLQHEMDIEVPKGYFWDGEMQVRAGPLGDGGAVFVCGRGGSCRARRVRTGSRWPYHIPVVVWIWTGSDGFCAERWGACLYAHRMCSRTAAGSACPLDC
jgi:hypothetical protein